MSMRIIAGRLGGRRLQVPKGRLTRPATDRVRESIFNLIEARKSFDGVNVLDLYCGTGALGLEAISRGARRATFVELNRRVLRVARNNAESLGVADQCTFLQRDAVRFAAAQGDSYDLIFADPPYDIGGLEDLPSIVLPLVASGGLFLLEHDRRVSFNDIFGWVESRAYGRTIVSIFGPIE